MGDFIVDVLNALIASVGRIIGTLLAIFPDSPFQSPAEKPDNVHLDMLNWLIPFQSMMVHLTYLAGAISVYYIVRIAARWAKMVRS